MIFDVLQLIGGFILAFGWLPQIMQIIRTKSVKDLNVKTFWMMFIGIGLMEAYGISLAADGVGIAFLITNTMSLVFIMAILVCFFIFRTKGEAVRAEKNRRQ